MQFSENPLHGQGPSVYNEIMSQRKKKTTRLALMVLGLVLLILLLAQVVHLTKTFVSPWKKAGEAKNYSWDGQFNINLVIKANTIAVLSFNPKMKKIIILEIPENMFLEVPHNFGKWQLRAVYDLGQSSSFGGDRLLKQSISQLLGLPIDGFLETTGNLTEKGAEESVKILRQNPLNIFATLSNFKSDLSLWELIKLKLALSTVRFDKVKVLNLSNLNVLDKEKLADGSEVYVADPDRLGSILADFLDNEIDKEHLSIAIFNADKRLLEVMN